MVRARPTAFQKARDTQDEAAGGRANRHRRRADGTYGLASIDIKSPKGGDRFYAYLRHREGTRDVVTYVGPVEGETHEARLKDGWRLAKANKLTSKKPSTDGA